MSAIAVVQARMGSERLPGKVLMPLGDSTVLGWVVRAARAADHLGEIVVATSVNPDCDAIAQWCDSNGVPVVRGSEDDVLGRFMAVLSEFGGDPVVRLTADCPLLDPAVIDGVVQVYETSGADYVATDLEPHLPRGTDVEAVSTSVLRWAHEHAAGVDRVHVTSAIYASPSRFQLESYRLPFDAGSFRATLDTPDDYRALQLIVEALGDSPPPIAELIGLLRRRPDIVAINEHVAQRSIGDG